MIDIHTESDFQVSSPLVIGNRKIVFVSKRSLISFDKEKCVFAGLVNPAYLIIEEGDFVYAFSVPHGGSINLAELFTADLKLKREIFEKFGKPTNIEIINNENRVHDVYPTQSLIQNMDEKPMSTIGTEKEMHVHEHRMALEDVRKEMMHFGNQLHEYFDSVQAEVENYKFVVEKHGEGIEVEVEFKANIHPEHVEALKMIPK